MPFAVHLLSCYWLIDDHRNLAIRNGDEPPQAYATVHAVEDEPLRIEWQPGRLGQRRTTIGGTVKRLQQDETGWIPRLIDDRLAADERHRP